MSNNSFDAKSLLYSMIDMQSIQLISILGIGAYGVVYLGRNVYSRKHLAVKLLTHLNVSYKEVDIHAYLSGHPNILRFEKCVFEGGKTFMVIEYTPEGDLFSAITHHHHIVGNNEAIRHIFVQIIDAVHYCHQNNISHRDLKPENILLGSKLQVKLADFGLATMDQVSTEFGCGSTFYFSPECQGGSNRIKGYSTQKNDIWSLGIILINLTAGRNPWKQANTRNTAFANYVRNPRHFFRTILPCISDELERILLRVLCLNPAKRISLPDLRHYVLKCQSFVVPQHYTAAHHQQEDLKTLKKKSHPMVYTDSIAQTMLQYIGGYTDDN